MDEYCNRYKTELHQCDTCKGMFLKSTYSDHVTYCSRQTSDSLPYGDKMFWCRPCQTRETDATDHAEEHLANKPYKCSECTFSSNTRIDVQRHCLRTSCAPKHAKVVTANDRECGSCQKVFRDKNLYLTHYMETHTIMLQQFDWCNDCNLWIKAHKAQRHLQKVHSKTFRCEICGKGYKSQAGLNDHKLTHEEPAKPCGYCGKTFKRKELLRIHVRNVHEKYVGKSYVCSYCGHTYKAPCSIQTHISKIHGSTVYACEVCGKCSKTAYARDQHMLTHSQDRPFKCAECSKRFKSSTAVSVHMASHSDERKFKCNLCDWSFKQKSHLTYHMRSHSCHGLGLRDFSPCSLTLME